MSEPKILDTQQSCPCGSTKQFGSCCKLLLDGQHASTAESLMRARYTAFVIGHADYLMQTSHPAHRQSLAELNTSLGQQNWVSLRILATEKGQQKDQHGNVEFIAFYQHDHHHHHDGHACNGLHQHHEKSYFVRENNQWYYTAGDFLKPIKLGRNDPCWCGSNKKTKQCHGIG